jgi:hypothetical protein
MYLKLLYGFYNNIAVFTINTDWLSHHLPFSGWNGIGL